MRNDKKLAGQVARGVIDFLKKIKKEDALDAIIEILAKEKNARKALVYSPIDLKKSDRVKISKMVYNLTGEKPEAFIFRKDEKLIDGLKIFYKDKLWDFSVASQIKKVLESN